MANRSYVTAKDILAATPSIESSEGTEYKVELVLINKLTQRNIFDHRQGHVGTIVEVDSTSFSYGTHAEIVRRLNNPSLWVENRKTSDRDFNGDNKMQFAGQPHSLNFREQTQGDFIKTKVTNISAAEDFIEDFIENVIEDTIKRNNNGDPFF